MPERRLRPSPIERDAPSPAVARLRRLRITLTLLFTVAMAIGLGALAILVVHKDSEARLDSLESTMGRRVTGASRLIYYSNRGRLRLDGLREDDLTAGTPEIRVFDGTGAHPRPVFAGVQHGLPVGYAELASIAHRAVVAEGLVATTVEDRSGDRVRLLAGPFFQDPNGDAAGAVVSVALLTETEAEHRELVLTVVLGCGALLLFAAAAGYLLAGRSLRPAARSLAQQEALLADAAHELRTPIASIRASLETAQIDPADAERAIEEARRSSARMGDTLDALLAWARLDAGAEPAGMSELRLDQLVEDVAGELERDGRGRIAIDAEPTVVRGDPTLLRVAVRNLLDNALRHGGAEDDAAKIERAPDDGGEDGNAPDDGREDGRAPDDGREDDGAPPVAVVVAGGSVTVSDRGPGIPADGDASVRRFGPTAPGGTGLGLSIAARIAELHGGELIARDRDGGGAEVVLVLSRLG